MSFRPLDQYEVEPNTFYSGSYTDPIFSGSIYTRNRRIIASQASGSDELRIAQLYSDFADYSGSNRNRSLGTGFRFRHFVSSVERYQDTLLPDILAAFYLNGGLPALAVPEHGANVILQTGTDYIPGLPVGKLVFSTFGTTASFGGTQVSDAIWFASFPFQGRYVNVPKTVNQTFYLSLIVCPASESGTPGVVRYGGVSGAGATSSLATAEVIIPHRFFDPTPPGAGATEPIRYTLIDVTGSVNTSEQFRGLGINLYPPGIAGLFGQSAGVVRPQQKQLTKFFYGFGDNYQGVPIVNAVTSSHHYSGVGVINGFYASSIDIRGWRYGCVSGFPYYSSCVFRSSRYGQFRDMFEQRKYTKFFNPNGITADGKNNGKKGSTDAVLNIRFVSGSQAALTASSPSTLNPNDSGIYDFEYKSGQPFHDV